MKKLKVAIIGLGFIGESHIEAVRRIGNCELYGVLSSHPEKAKAKAEYYGIPKCYNSLEELLADPDVDVIHNCTPNRLHHEINCKVIRAGKHLFSEKPLCATYQEAEELLAAQKEHPEVAAGVNFNYRLNPLVIEMRSRISNSEIGDVRIISGYFLQDWLLYDTDYSWRLEPELSGPSCCVADIGSHWMDTVQFVTGHRITEVMADVDTVIPVRKKPLAAGNTFTSEVSAEYEEVEVKNEDYGAVLFKTDKGARGVFYVSELCPGHGCDLNFEIDGSKASFRWDQEECEKLWMGHRDGANYMITREPNAMTPEARAYASLAKGHPEGWNDAFKGNIQSFYRYIQEGMTGEAPFATIEQAAYVVKLTEAILKSSKERKWVEIK